jgi:hypothetical protein
MIKKNAEKWDQVEKLGDREKMLFLQSEKRE